MSCRSGRPETTVTVRFARGDSPSPAARSIAPMAEYLPANSETALRELRETVYASCPDTGRVSCLSADGSRVLMVVRHHHGTPTHEGCRGTCRRTGTPSPLSRCDPEDS